MIKKNVLKLNSKVETNSLDSHLSRIRKKLDIIKTTIKIQSKNNELNNFVFASKLFKTLRNENFT